MPRTLRNESGALIGSRWGWRARVSPRRARLHLRQFVAGDARRVRLVACRTWARPIVRRALLSPDAQEGVLVGLLEVLPPVALAEQFCRKLSRAFQRIPHALTSRTKRHTPGRWGNRDDHWRRHGPRRHWRGSHRPFDGGRGDRRRWRNDLGWAGSCRERRCQRRQRLDRVNPVVVEQQQIAEHVVFDWDWPRRNERAETCLARK